MAYEYERDEWRSAVQTLTEADRDNIAGETRQRHGIVGDPSDAYEDLTVEGGDDD